MPTDRVFGAGEGGVGVLEVLPVSWEAVEARSRSLLRDRRLGNGERAYCRKDAMSNGFHSRSPTSARLPQSNHIPLGFTATQSPIF